MGGYISFPVRLISALTEKPLLYNIYYTFSFIYIKVNQWIKKNRFDLYDYKATGQPYKHGFLVPKEEWILETPNDSQNLNEFSDNAFCFSVNPDNEYLSIHLSRLPGNNVHCAIVLQTSDGRQFTLPDEHAIQKSTSEENTFGSSRLKLQCLIPMRRWRIFFNGILEEKVSSNQERKLKHVKFTLLWSPSADVFDCLHEMSKELVLDIAAAQQNVWPLQFIQRLKSFFNCYYHTGMFNGTLNIENEDEREIYLWGYKGRHMGELPKKLSNFAQVMGNFENGCVLCLGFSSVEGLWKSFPFGFFMTQHGSIHAIDKIEGDEESLAKNGAKIYFSSGGRNYACSITYTKSNGPDLKNGHLWSTKTLNIDMNGKIGRGFLFEGRFDNKSLAKNLENKAKISVIHDIFENFKNTSLLTVPFSDERCRDSSLTGGKGSSLAKLLKLSSDLKRNAKKPEFAVPNGIVVTTVSYDAFIKGSLEKKLDEFEKDIWNGNVTDIRNICQKVTNIVGETELPERIVQSILTDLRVVFGESVPHRKFSVRSSATGEDTEQMSAAGQMETFLGVKGLSEIIKAVAKCWASQFAYEAVEYKRRYGQKLNTPMAVVIQEMVSCEAAGVMFTCDPVTGNPSFISITGNWGLGESVVSGSAEPDTIVLEKIIDKSIRFHSQTLGDKKTCTVMETTNGTKEVTMTDEQSKSCCISEEMSMQLGYIALEIENYYGSSQDTEWGIANGNIFFFQSRPVTSVDSTTDFETKHFFDTFQRTANEYFSKANVGEVMPGASSILGMDLMFKFMEISYGRQILDWDTIEVLKKPYFPKKCLVFMNHFLFAMLEGFFGFDTEPNDLSKSFIISMFGRLIDDSELRRCAQERFALRKPRPLALWKKIGMNLMLFLAGKLARRQANITDKIKICAENYSSAAQLFKDFSEQYDLFPDAMNCHMHCSLSSSLWNLPLLTTLASANGDWDHKVFSDFANLIKVNSDVVSADVPAAMEDLASSISKNINPEDFKQFSPEDALQWLKNDTSEAGAKFKEFIKNHGHRCIREFDAFSETWAMNPKPIMSTLKGLVMENSTVKAKKHESLWSSISNLQVKISLFNKLKLLLILPNARRGVREREFSKSMVIKVVSKLRLPLHQLSELMVKEGRLPRKELMFYLCFEEIYQLLKTRSPILVSKAIKRWKCYDDLNSMIFPEIIVGIPKPINQDEETPSIEDGFTMTGVPVSQGISKAPARVIMSVNEADTIQNGDILITYSTDIAWSPYFPRLSGVVTELGGLISHGAVVAREYGLPCVVCLHGATKAFKTGDMVKLDGNKGTLQKIG